MLILYIFASIMMKRITPIKIIITMHYRVVFSYILEVAIDKYWMLESI